MNSMKVVKNGWNLSISGESEVYVLDEKYPADRGFVARFKYRAPAANAKHFVKFLVANFSPAEYFEARKVEGSAGTPLKILEAKGYVSYNMLKWSIGLAKAAV